MKKLVVLLMCMWAVSTFAQDSTKCNVSKYVSYGLSLSNNSDFKSGTFTSLEFGLMSNDITMGLAIGRGNLVGIFDKNDNIRNYYYELKLSPYFPIGKLYGNVIMGVGGYMDTKHNFIEYGFGLSYTHNKMGYGVCYSNWDGFDYITPYISYNF